ncbi:adenosine deaminase [Myxococcus fulvus]|uniref:adenosine deaminase n=1 Tax=Myxococcus fulvus TaxID=33 RepID=A0A511T7N0_MYXFU|nr:hypothetical protein [Myxococcus fulvus]AKF85686.1 hypothetical protein MFUL124B02_14535 [Myxococcus fulvus 124B02]GEN10170.1 adenosine deaminase [Myxococcus fulvus]SEU35264.1 adenosine deaminase [Myxococcus fulvus]
MSKLSLVVVAMTLGLSACRDDPDPPTPRPPEDLTQEHMETLRSNPTALAAFLRDMPKGGDLHSHTSGAITMEKLIQWGSEDGACVNPTTYVASNPCEQGATPLSNTASDRALYDAVMGAWSMEGFTGPLLEAHQHFFDAFAKYGAVQTEARGDDIYADILSRAGHHNQVYVELMQGFGASTGGRLAAPLFSPTDPWDAPTLLSKRAQLIALPEFQTALTRQAESIASFLVGSRQVMACGTPQADPGCDVEVRLLVSANRTAERANVFGQWVYAFELAQRVPQIVGVNLVSPEEHPNSLAYYNDEMFALGTLDDHNDTTPGRKTVHVSLHAGELIPEVLKPEDQGHLRFHIRNAVKLAHAERIGHGVDVLGETDGEGVDALLRDMREAGVLVEICLSSNNVLLGVKGTDHPLSAYLVEKVPVTLATDDSGILRGDITQEYVAAAAVQGLDYKTLKQLARASLEHAFVEGDSLWAQRDVFTTLAAACAQDDAGEAGPSSSCQTFLGANTRAALQWRLEAQFTSFEARFAN